MIANKDFVAKNLPKHKPDAHKGDRGRVLVVGGSRGLTGAVCMTANAALHSGAGLITVAVPATLNSVYEVKLTEIMSLPVADDNGKFKAEAKDEIIAFAKQCDAVAIGPGMGVNEGAFEILKCLLVQYNKKIIIDADGLNVLSKDTSMLKKTDADVLITPHIGEMSRLTGKAIEEITKNKIQIATEFSKEFGVNVLLKGKDTVITDGNEVFINPTGNNGMAKGGSGDVLTGICVSISAQGIDCFKSGILGAYIHGLAGDIAKEELTDYAMTPCDIIDYLAKAFKNIC